MANPKLLGHTGLRVVLLLAAIAAAAFALRGSLPRPSDNGTAIILSDLAANPKIWREGPFEVIRSGPLGYQISSLDGDIVIQVGWPDPHLSNQPDSISLQIPGIPDSVLVTRGLTEEQVRRVATTAIKPSRNQAFDAWLTAIAGFMPQLTGLERSEVSNNGLFEPLQRVVKVKLLHTASASEPCCTIIRQSVEPNSKLVDGLTVELVVSEGGPVVLFGSLDEALKDLLPDTAPEQPVLVIDLPDGARLYKTDAALFGASCTDVHEVARTRRNQFPDPTFDSLCLLN